MGGPRNRVRMSILNTPAVHCCSQPREVPGRPGAGGRSLSCGDSALVHVQAEEAEQPVGRGLRFQGEHQRGSHGTWGHLLKEERDRNKPRAALSCLGTFGRCSFAGGHYWCPAGEGWMLLGILQCTEQSPQPTARMIPPWVRGHTGCTFGSFFRTLTKHRQ